MCRPPTLKPRPRYCSECARGEVRALATSMVAYLNPDRPGLVIRTLVCDSHAEMLGQDYEVVREQRLLPQHRLEAEGLREELPDHLREIADGRRVGIPTLNRSDSLERAAGILSPTPVAWRLP